MNHPLPVAAAGALHWHEAVALVHEVADAVADGRLASVPSTRVVALEPDGALFCNGGADARGVPRDVRPAEVVAGLKRLLGDLLDTTAPAELQALAEATPPGQPAPGLEPFIRALAFFERPSRHADLEALAGRLREVREKRDLDAELERLTRKARDDEAELPPAPPDAGARTRARRPRLLLAIVLGAAALAVLAALMLAWPVAGSSRAALLATELPKDVIGKLRSAAASTFRPPAREATPPSDAAPKREPQPRRQRQPEAAPAPPRAANLPERSRSEVEIYRAPKPDVVEVFVSEADAAGVPRSSPTVYDDTNQDVVPAILVRPRLPRITSSAVLKGPLGRLEVLVGQDGQVEQVRLLATSVERRYYDAMILAAVKAWVFQPATRDGRAVRYRLEVPLP